MYEEKFEFTSSIKRKLLITLVVGLAVLALGILLLNTGGHGDGHEEAAAAAEGGHHEFHWTQRLYANLWINSVFWTGISLIGVFWIAIQYAAQAGWSALFKRVPEAFGYWLPIGGVLLLIVFFASGHDIFHWKDLTLYEIGHDNYDPIIAGKRSYLNTPFFLIRMVGFVALWFIMFLQIRKHSLAEDIEGGESHFWKMRVLSTIFIVIFAITTSVAAWDWILSIDTHWYSTLIGWYVFASWFAGGLAFITLVVAILKENGYLKMVNAEHLHDLGKFVFAFSIFWTYLWVSQYLLINYANIPEESVYYMERLKSGFYWPVFHINLLLNFVFPFLMLMTRESKRHIVFLKIACTGVVFGHWLDFYLMVTPGTLKENGGFGFMEIGMLMVFLAAFLYVVLSNLAKAPLVAKNHPMIEESVHHHV